MSKNDENEVIDFDELMLKNADAARNAGMEFSKKIEEYENCFAKADVTADNYSPYFSSTKYRSLIGRYDNEVRSLVAFISLVSNIENDVISTVLWDYNPFIHKNINPGDRLLHISPRDIAGFFEELVKFKA